LGIPATLAGIARLRTDGNLGAIRYVAEDGGDEFGVRDFGNSGFTTFSGFGQWCSRRFRGGRRYRRYNLAGRIGGCGYNKGR
jgi:hypothetical protein